MYYYFRKVCLKFLCSATTNKKFLNKNTDRHRKLQKNCNTYFLAPKGVVYRALQYGRFLPK